MRQADHPEQGVRTGGVVAQDGREPEPDGGAARSLPLPVPSFLVPLGLRFLAMPRPEAGLDLKPRQKRRPQATGSRGRGRDARHVTVSFFHFAILTPAAPKYT